MGVDSRVSDLLGSTDAIKDLAIQDIEVPKFYIPNWPKNCTVNGDLGRRKYRVPAIQKNGLLAWKEGKCRVSFSIDKQGVIIFAFHGLWGKPVFDQETTYGDYGTPRMVDVHWASSNHDKNISRLGALMLFNQFRSNIISMAISDINAQTHNDVVEQVKTAFEPFVPYAVADRLAEL